MAGRLSSGRTGVRNASILSRRTGPTCGRRALSRPWKRMRRREMAFLQAVKCDLSIKDLHASLSDPLLDTMNFLNEVTFRYPEAVSFAPGRPYDGFFDIEQIFAHLRGYVDYLAASGNSPGQIRDAL